MHKIDITKAAGKYLKKLPLKQYRQVVSTILALRENPTPNDSKQLSGYAGYGNAPGLSAWLSKTG